MPEGGTVVLSFEHFLKHVCVYVLESVSTSDAYYNRYVCVCDENGDGTKTLRRIVVDRYRAS